MATSGITVGIGVAILRLSGVLGLLVVSSVNTAKKTSRFISISLSHIYNKVCIVVDISYKTSAHADIKVFKRELLTVIEE